MPRLWKYGFRDNYNNTLINIKGLVMNIRNLLEMQKELDIAIFKKSDIDVYPTRKIELALRVELGELAQEFKEFKYWKKTKGEVNREKMLEEWADVFHFALSLENEEGNSFIDRAEEIAHRLNSDYTVYHLFQMCFKDPTVPRIIALGLNLGFTFKEMEQAYRYKNKINWDRVNGGY
ncbi:hypothetical protein CP523_13160 [Clostridium septicum]|uniref:dUTPase n=2 Tax=Clostridium septicum TaxID=1504 RepID=A0A9N7PML9_CLOSE|nr:hypothetical protein CP523_13160 [Clostridium septicum]QAS60686.1 hypothetical protein EI377_08005 [Clostridium septicum]